MATTEEIDLVIDENLHAGMRKHTAAEAKAFDEDVAREGRYRESIKYWHSGDHLNLILDGRQRYEHWSNQPNSTALQAPGCEEVFLPDWDSAREWVLRNQLGRRNLDTFAFKSAIGELYNLRKKPHGDQSRMSDSPRDQIDLLEENKAKTDDTAEQIAEEHGLSAPTVKRYGALVEAKNEISQKLPILLTEIENGTVKMSDSAIKQAAKLSATKLGTVRKNLNAGLKWNDGLAAAATPDGQNQDGSGSGKNGGKDGAGASAAVVLDVIKREVPKHLAEKHALAASMQSLGSRLDAIKRDALKLCEQQGGEFLDDQEVTGAFKSVKSILMQARYWSECPRCKGKPKSDCDRCGGNGFLPFSRKGTLSDADKEWLGVN